MRTLQDPQKIEKIGSFFEQVENAHRSYFDYWRENTFLHWDFWGSVFFAIVPWLLWIRLRKKESSSRLLFVAFIVIIITCLMDFVGSVYGLWFYTGKIIPTMPSFVPWDFSILPVTVMLLIQYKPKASVFLKSIIFAVFAAFIGEPIFLWIGFYVIKKWSVFYSFPIYMLLYLLSHRISQAKNFEEIA